MVNMIDFLGEIQWSFCSGVFQGSIADSDIVNYWIGNGDSGTLEVVSPILSGSQETRMSWYRDEEEETVKFRVLSVTESK